MLSRCSSRPARGAPAIQSSLAQGDGTIPAGKQNMVAKKLDDRNSQAPGIYRKRIAPEVSVNDALDPGCPPGAHPFYRYGMRANEPRAGGCAPAHGPEGGEPGFSGYEYL